MNGDGGLIALSKSDCARLVRWGAAVEQCPMSPGDAELLARLREWGRRHSVRLPSPADSGDIPG